MTKPIPPDKKSSDAPKTNSDMQPCSEAMPSVSKDMLKDTGMDSSFEMERKVCAVDDRIQQGTATGASTQTPLDKVVAL